MRYTVYIIVEIVGLLYLQNVQVHGMSPTRPMTSCDKPLDVILAIDSSGSVYSMFNNTIDFTERLVSNFVIGDEKVKVGIIDFSMIANAWLPLTSGNNLGKVYQALEELRHRPQNGETHTDLALQVAIKMFKESQRNAPKALVIITDGELTSGLYDELGYSLFQLAVMNVFNFVVKEGDAVHEGLHRLVSKPEHDFLFDLTPNANSARYATQGLTDGICYDTGTTEYDVERALELEQLRKNASQMLNKGQQASSTQQQAVFDQQALNQQQAVPAQQQEGSSQIPATSTQQQTAQQAVSTQQQILSAQQPATSNQQQTAAVQQQVAAVQQQVAAPQQQTLTSQQPSQLQQQTASAQPQAASAQQPAALAQQQLLPSQQPSQPQVASAQPQAASAQSQAASAQLQAASAQLQAASAQQQTASAAVQDKNFPQTASVQPNLQQPIGNPKQTYPEVFQNQPSPDLPSENAELQFDSKSQDQSKNYNSVQVAAEKCNINYTKVGCLNDFGLIPKPLPLKILEDKKNGFSAGVNNSSFNKAEWEKFLPEFICKCANAARQKNFWTFGIQNYDECYSGYDEGRYDEDGTADPSKCKNRKGQICDEKSDYCSGERNTNYIYTVITSRHSGIVKIEYD